MERTILSVAIDSFPIQAERLRCPKLRGRPVALIPGESQRPRVVMVSREGREAGIAPGTPLVHARRLCRDLVAVPLDREFYGGIGTSIFQRLSPFAPVVEPGTVGPTSSTGHFFLDLTGVVRGHPEARDRASRAGRDVETSFRLHPTLGVAANKLVSRVAAEVVAPDGDLVDVSSGSEATFLAPLSVHALPCVRRPDIGARLDLLNVCLVRQIQDLPPAHLARVFGEAGLALSSEARGIDPSPVRPPETGPRVVVEETLAGETNDSRVLSAHVERLAIELCGTLAARQEGPHELILDVEYADGHAARARRTFAEPLAGRARTQAAVGSLLERGVRRRVRVRRLRVSALELAPESGQLTLWDSCPSAGSDRADSASLGPRALGCVVSFGNAVDRARSRFGTEALVPASWMLHGLAVRASPRP